MKIPKINTVHYGGKWILLSIMVGAVIPVLVWVFLHVFLWWMVVAGEIVLLSFLAVFAIEMKQDFGKIPFYEKTLTSDITYDEETQYAVIKASICTGEKVAGFKNKKDFSFTEVMLIRTPEDLERFKKMYGLDKKRNINFDVADGPRVAVMARLRI